MSSFDPRIFTAGELVAVTGGHGSGPSGEGNDGPDEFRKAVRREIFLGADWIKIAISGGIADTHGDIAASTMSRDEMEAVIDTAHRHGVKVTAHSGSPLATDEAINLGLDCVEHGYFLTPQVLHKMKERGVWLVPTIVVSQPTALPFFEKIGSPDWYLARVASVGKQHWATLQAAIKEGVKIALGTDQFPFEPNDGTTATIREAQYYVQAGAVFPFIDTTPHGIAQAHIAITDSTSDCHPGAAAPDNIKILVGQAGVALVPVMDKSTNTGIFTTPGQCVFHVTINAGQAGVPNNVTDIVVLNGGSSALSGINTVTASATVRVGEVTANWHRHGHDGGVGNSN